MKKAINQFGLSLLTGTFASLLLISGCTTETPAPLDTPVAVEESAAPVFVFDDAELEGATPWTSDEFLNNPNNFHFAIIGDRTGGANIERTFELAMPQLNLMRPEFVINVGDIIEGYTEDIAELNAEWDEVDIMLDVLDMPFFRTVGNHDVSGPVSQQVWRARHGATYYHFVYKDVLFVVLDSEDNSRPEPPEGMAESIELYNRLQTEDPEEAQRMLEEFMKDESIVAALSVPVEFSEEQLEWLSKTLANNKDVRWTFLFMHEPAWENPSESFKAMQAMVQERNFTWFAGHLHYYDYDRLDGRDYITMGPAGASFHHEGPGNVDHITWVTMTDDGAEIGNVALKGIFDRKGLDPSLFGAYDRKGSDEE
jgi:hypothetical protein